MEARDATGQALRYFDDEPGRRSAANLLTRERRAAGNTSLYPGFRQRVALSPVSGHNGNGRTG